MLDDPSKNDSSAMILPGLLPPRYKKEHSLWGENATAVFISLTNSINNFKLSFLIKTGRGEGGQARTWMATSLWGENATAVFISLTTPIINFKLSSLIMTGRGEGGQARTWMATRSRARRTTQFPVARVHGHLRR